ncbi:MAG: GNAT family N-acetyltransferase [Candidatus Woesearchaeota archaeon]|jgi:RimJ/RimL family protein N-acetyltransferase|nr:GNAT family N-acetyltransferase [Candidatus Woesearchaeota archaeon]MDP7181215.1 GNAT family N-acetyltransferase [Candidatus Woesearchaeota archaeon]MDP7198165.1 GNAT family N-acetyltransferase [Candidatus Woesearchaeota archaeon]MDP7467000.1 GNAT family N-acetyltransferase [Candidatus Woesearchaeota archaeon]MDP7646670.1 GNAT family N-acetyltransferase [Candidatus Woesearchaeota archaeon]
MEIILRHLTMADAEVYLKAHDEDAAKFFSSHPTTLEEAKEEIQEALDAYDVPKEKRTKETFAIEMGGVFAGFIAIHHIVQGKEGTTGSLVAPEFRGKGVGTQAHKLLLEYAFKTYKLKKIYGRVKPANIASQKMLEKSGYKYEKTIETPSGEKRVYSATLA